MTRFFYDFDDGKVIERDDLGIDLASDDAAISAAWKELPNMVSALDETAHWTSTEIVVRRECGRTIARLEVQVTATLINPATEAALNYRIVPS